MTESRTRRASEATSAGATAECAEARAAAKRAGQDEVLRRSPGRRWHDEERAIRVLCTDHAEFILGTTNDLVPVRRSHVSFRGLAPVGRPPDSTHRTGMTPIDSKPTVCPGFGLALEGPSFT